MTKEELQKIPFHFVASAAWEDEHTPTYESEDGRLGYCDHTPRRKNGQFGRTRRHWHIDGKVYKTEEKFLAALADFNPSVVGIRDKPYQNTVPRMKHERDSRHTGAGTSRLHNHPWHKASEDRPDTKKDIKLLGWFDTGGTAYDFDIIKYRVRDGEFCDRHGHPLMTSNLWWCTLERPKTEAENK